MPKIIRNATGLAARRWQPPSLSDPRPAAAPLEPLTAGTLETATAPAVDPLAEAQAAATAELEQARRQAAQVLAEARTQGYNDGLARAEVEMSDKRRELDELAEQINQRQASFFERMQPEVIELAVAIAGKVVGHEVEADPDLVIDQVKGCIRRLQERERVRVRVNPEDVTTLREAKEELMADFDGVRRIDVVDDRRVGRGGCIVESESGTLDARLDRQLKEVERVLLEADKGGNDA